MSHFPLAHPSMRKRKEKKKKRNINNDLAVLPSHNTWPGRDLSSHKPFGSQEETSTNEVN